MPVFNTTLTSLTETNVFNGDSAYDYFGSSVSSAGDVNGDGFDDIIVGAYDDDNNGPDSGSARVFSGADGTVLFTFNGDSADDEFGSSVSGAGDVNGDGFDDLIVGARGDDNNGSNSGNARILSGADGTILFTFDGDDAYDSFGDSVSGAGDVNGDGFDDVIVGASLGDNTIGVETGSAVIFSGQTGAKLFSFFGDGDLDLFGAAVSGIGDVNGDGIGDVIVGAPSDDNTGNLSGSARVFSGADGAILFTVNGDSGGDRFGQSVSGAGDVNGDGFADFIVGAFGDALNGVYSGGAEVFSGSDGSLLFSFDGDNANDRFGGSVSGVGDINGDGFDDVIVGAFFDDNNGSYSGNARIFSGADGSQLFSFDGEMGEALGTSISSAGDVNGDGFGDVIIGGYGGSNNGSASGIARLFTTTGTGALDSVRIFAAGSSGVVLDDDVAVADAVLDALNGGAGDYDGASLNIVRNGGGDGDDVFAFAAMSNVTVSGGNLLASGNVIATFTVASGVLNINFTNANGTSPSTALINEIIQAVTYENTGPVPGSSEKIPLLWTFSDGVNDLIDTIDVVHSTGGGGTPGDDVFIATSSDDNFNGGAHGDGGDTVTFGGATSAVSVYLSFTGIDTGGSGVDTLINIENLTGSAFNDRLIGDANDNVLTGGDGVDILKGKGGNDTFHGGDGDDKMVGGAGDDTMFGGDGNDTLIALAGLDILNGGKGNDALFGGRDSDTLNGNFGSDNIRGNLGNDIINGGANGDTLRGGGQNDTLNGDGGNDFLFGENHLDTLFGGAGDDSLTGGVGGGAFDGFTDTFIYKDTGDGGGGFDRIKDFENGIDVMDLQSFGFANFAAVQALTSDSGVNMRINFGGGDVLFVENFHLADFDAGDVLL